MAKLRSEAVIATCTKITLALADGPKTGQQLRELVTLPKGKDDKFFQNCLTRLRARGEVRHSIVTKLWELTGGEAAAGAGVGTATIASPPPPPPRSEAPRPPSRIGSPEGKANGGLKPVPPPAKPVETPEPPPAAAAPDAQNIPRNIHPEPNIQGNSHPAAAPVASSTKPPAPASLLEKFAAAHPGEVVQVTGDEAAYLEREATDDAAAPRMLDLDVRVLGEGYTPRRVSRETPGSSRIDVRINLSIGPREIVALGDDAGEVLRAVAILMQAEDQLSGAES